MQVPRLPGHQLREGAPTHQYVVQLQQSARYTTPFRPVRLSLLRSGALGAALLYFARFFFLDSPAMSRSLLRFMTALDLCPGFSAR